jgi:ferredoxin
VGKRATAGDKRDAWRTFTAQAKRAGLDHYQLLVARLYSTSSYFWFQKNIRGPFTTRRSKERFSQHYHGKVLTQEQAEGIVTVERDIPLRDLEQVVPYDMARDFVLQAPADIVVTECVCRLSSPDGCKPSQVCMIIGKPITDAILAFEAKDSRRITREEAVNILREERDRGHFHTAYFKDAMLNRFYAICNCCKCHCLGLRMMVRYHVGFLSPSGYSSRRDPAACSSCGRCAEACPFEAIELDNRGISLDRDKCMGCGICVEMCPRSARTLVRDEERGVPLDVRMMTAAPIIR